MVDWGSSHSIDKREQSDEIEIGIISETYVMGDNDFTKKKVQSAGLSACHTC